MEKNLTRGSVPCSLIVFSLPMIAGNLLQQFYNITDTLIVGRFLGAEAMASVGTAYTLMTFLTSIIIGLCMGSGALFSFYHGKGDAVHMKDCIRTAFVFIGAVSIVINLLVLIFVNPILRALQIPAELTGMMHQYICIIFMGIFFTFLYNYFSYLLRAVGNSVVPLYFLGSTSVLNVILDLLFVAVFHWGIAGAAYATIFSQAVSGVGIALYTRIKRGDLRFSLLRGWHMNSLWSTVREVVGFSAASSVQQSVMNLGILMIQGLVNSFGVSVMAAFTAAVKIDSLAYMPAQEFGNAYSLFISQNFGAGEKQRIKEGTKWAFGISAGFCACVCLLVFCLAERLMLFFVSSDNTEIITIGAQYLRIEGAFYWGIGILFLLYGYYRGINRPQMSLILTVISLGTRVILAYLLAPVESIGVLGIWWAIPIGWMLADITGVMYMRRQRKL